MSLCTHFVIAFTVASAVFAWPHVALADVVGPVSGDDNYLHCPSGTILYAMHRGGHCQPPLRADCPPGYEPRVIGNVSFCAPPPPAPCPRGMIWVALAQDDARCIPGDSCARVKDCSHGATCEELSFCFQPLDDGEEEVQSARGTCTTQAHCEPFPGSTCEKRSICVDPDTRRHLAQRIAAAKDVPPSAVPALYVAMPNGDPPPYPILADGQQLPALPDVPEPPEVMSQAVPEITPPHSTRAPRTPRGRGGCAGCKVDTSDRDMAAWAGFMSLLGLGIALRRRSS